MESSDDIDHSAAAAREINHSGDQAAPHSALCGCLCGAYPSALAVNYTASGTQQKAAFARYHARAVHRRRSAQRGP
jgi:hypothetical protein